MASDTEHPAETPEAEAPAESTAPETVVADAPPPPPKSFQEMSAEEAIAFDFFDQVGVDESGKTKPPAEPAAESAEAALEPPQPKPTISTPPPAPPPPTAPDPAIEQLRSELAAMRAQNETLNAALARVTQPAAPAAQPQAQQQARVFNFDVPDELVDGLGNEDPRVRKNVLKILLDSQGDMVYRKVMTDMQEQVGNRITETIQQQTAQQRYHEAVFNDFYTAYPHLNRDDLRPMIVSVAGAVAKETGATTWSPGFRDAIAARVTAILAGHPAGPAPRKPAEVPRATPKRPGGGVRPSQPAGNEFADAFEQLMGSL